MSLLLTPPPPTTTNNPTSSSSLLPAAGTATTKRKTKKTTVVTTLMTKSNLFVQSETGSGKTLAYLLPIVQHLASSSSSSDHTTTTNSSSSNNSRYDNGTKCIILCPTRELCTQTYDTIHKLCQFAGYSSYIVPGCLSGGEKRKSEKSRLRKGITILVATPGRLLDHLTKTESLILSLKKKKTMKNGGGESGGGLEWLVLDEADRLLDGGGLGGQVEQIIQRLRACCSDGGKNDNVIMWRNVLVSATITKELEEMANKVLGVHDDSWMWARGHTTATTPTDGQGGGGIMSATTSIMTSNQCFSDNNGNLSSSTQHATASDGANNNSHELDNAAPRQLAQLYMIVSAKLRLSSLIAFLVARAAKGERTVVFLSTCDSVDYHHALFTSMTSILENDDDEELSGKDSGIFGNACPIYKLHGDIPHNKRLSTLQSFNNTQQPQQQQQQQLQQQSAILLATDVAARGLNFSSLDWIVQYDPPCETKDYVHRAGRSARAGQAGHALLFLLPSERQYIEVLELRGLREISPLSLSSTLSSAATLCAGLTREGETKVSTTGGSNNTFASDGVKAEAFTFAIQNRLEQCVLQDDVNYKTAIEKKFKGDPKQRGRKQQRKKDALVGPLLEGARKAFSAFVRAYPAKEKSVRHIFNARALHLGHIARSLALKETPKMVSKGNNSSHGRGSGVNIIDIGGKGEKYVRDKLQSKSSKGEKRKSRLAFGDTPVEMMDTNDSVAIEDLEQDQYMSLLGHVIGAGVPRSSLSNKKSKHSGGHSGGNDAETRMMKAAMLMQSQEYM
jgi:ATP-dependent RNA helicase DDX31/DBP7